MPPIVARRTPYKDFLQPVLQARFAATVGLLLAIAYVQSLLLSTWDSLLWPWFPVGPAGLRTVLIFSSVILIVLLRIAHSHVGSRNFNSPFETLVRSSFITSTLETLLLYPICAFMFGHIYMWSVDEGSNLHWITRSSGDRPRMNERALFYIVNLVILGLVEAVVHLSADRNRILLGTVRYNSNDAAADNPSAGKWERLGQWAPTLVARAAVVSLAVSMFNYIILYHFVRRTAWSWALSFWRIWNHSLPKSNIPPAHAPWSIWMLGRSIWAGFLLCLLLRFFDMTFRLQLGKEPLKNGRPLTSDSKDPNGSLLNGLRNKKPRVAAFAMWEAALIARDFDLRRQLIFEDIDRKDGPAWSQIYAACMGAIKEVEQRVDKYGKPSTAPAASQATEPIPPRERVVQPPRSDDVWAPTPRSRHGLGDRAKWVSNQVTSPGKTGIGHEAKQKALAITDHLLTKEQKEAISSRSVNGMMQRAMIRVLGTPGIGWFFQESFGNRLARAVLGSPYGELSVPMNAAYTLSRLAVSSLTEDKYGNVQRDVPTIIRTFTTVIKKLEKFRDGFPLHWTDLEQKRECAEMEELLDGLKEALSELIEAFAPYAIDLGLTRADMRLAKEAAAKPQAEEVQGNGHGSGNGNGNGNVEKQKQPEMRQV
ncbi:nucleoporin protein Ndc1-Nup, partial [Xylariomycetidae sp. FL2044]